ncbi:RAxF-45 family protein [Ornithinibacillus xuwenensis]|uniref:RAxF-45 family protein n=1 Tax=Ornithinibacillus xuwenensis TaxID=3144668 RepID=A0ABU9XH28_9BACI
MLKTVLLHDYWINFLYFVRAKFAVVAADGIRMPFFSN